jgi:membrane protein DedA with SNARE-associated domain/rhodanese-related sulfurtransferase
VNNTLEFLVRHGYTLLFAAVLAEQLGLPVPAVPLLLAAGALAGLGRLELAPVLGLALLACLIGDVVWFYLGRQKGTAILRTLCKISLEPDSCVRYTEASYKKYGLATLVVAKFVPGLSVVAPPMAGLFRMSIGRFLALDGLGSALWAGLYILLGWLFDSQLEYVAEQLNQMGFGLGVLLVVGLTGYLGFKYAQRRKVFKALRMARIMPEELKRMMDAGEPLVVVDLRNALEREEGWIPGSVLLADIAQHEGAEVVLYCSCPDEVSSVRAALRLKRDGVGRVRPLEGGFPDWRELGYPVETKIKQ